MFNFDIQQDCYALRDVTLWLAESVGVSVEHLLTRFAVSVDMPATLKSMASLL